MTHDAKRDDDAHQQPLARRKQTNALLVHVQPAQLARSCDATTARPQPVTASPPPTLRRLHPVLRLFIGFCLCAALVIGTLGVLLLAGQTDLVASLVVGAVLVVVFGTPLLCVVGIIAFYVWAMTRVRRPALPQQPTKSPSPRSEVVVAEIIDD